MIASCEGYRYELPLTAPFQSGRAWLHSRHGVIVRIGDEGGYHGYGEAAPFPGLHAESVQIVLQQLHGIRPELLGQRFPQNVERLEGGFEGWLAPYALCPSLRFAVETAVLNLLANRQGCSLAGLLAPSYCKQLPINGLLVAGNTLKSQARELNASGYRAVKLKVGRQGVSDDIETVRAVRRLLNPDCSLRLDPNRRWDFETALTFGQAVADCDIEYIEEPLAAPERMPDFFDATGIPLALDESLIEQPASDTTVFPGVQALVLKPSVLGGLEPTMFFLRLAKQAKIKTVISSVFDSGIGLAALANAAAALCPKPTPAGLDTYRWLAEDLTVTPFTASNGEVDVDEVHRQAQQIRPDLVTQVV